MLARQHHQHPEWRLDPDEVDWGKFGGHVLDASYSVLPNLRAISLAPTFNRLTVLSVRASGLVCIDLLQSCARLVYLDLSSNKITHLGDGSFWASFPDLLVILLHGNMVSVSIVFLSTSKWFPGMSCPLHVDSVDCPVPGTPVLCP